MTASLVSAPSVQWFAEIDMHHLPQVGGKNASLGEMYRELRPRGIRVPNGFATTAAAYQEFLQYNGLDQQIPEILAGLDTNDIHNLRSCGAHLRQLFNDSVFPHALRDVILEAYHELGGGRSPISVAVRSSATAEDLPDASFAGQQETYLNVQGDQLVLDCVRRCYASLFTDRAISYRVHHGFDHTTVLLSVGIQEMVRSDLGAAGVMFSIDTETGFPDVVLINAAYGLGENVVQGAVCPDEYYVYKPTLRSGHRPILRKHLGSKELQMIYDIGGGRMTKNVPVPSAARSRFCLTEDEVLTLAHWACMIEDHYSLRRGSTCPMDMEWAKDGQTGELFIVQARPETVQSRRSKDVFHSYRLTEQGVPLVTGRAVGNRIGAGPVRVIEDTRDLHQFAEGEVLVTDKTDPDWEPVMKKAAAIVTNRGGRTCHAAIVSRELGVPAIVGAEHATERLATGKDVTVHCAAGETGTVYQGRLPFEVRQTQLTELRRPQTKIMLNAANPDEAFAQAQIPNDGVGLARMEFIINHHIQVHPMALLHFDQVVDKEARRFIQSRTAGYARKSDYFVDTLAQGIAMIGAAFCPRPVIVRMSDFKTNEYANLIGGRDFEPVEANPMIGFRGASRYYDPRYRDAFALECQAIKQVREDMGLENVKIMIPFCRTVAEGRQVLSVLAEQGLKQGERGLEVYVMCELPSNVLLAEEFAQLFDGFSIGSNDLTQLVLGIDRDSATLAHLFDERNEAVKAAIVRAIGAAKRAGKKIGICGQAPSDFPDFAAFLVEQGIDSLSLNPDAVLPTMLHIANLEDDRWRQSHTPAGEESA